MRSPLNSRIFLLPLALLAIATSNVHALLIWHSALDGDASALVGVDGVPTGTPTATEDINGNAGGAVLFDGVSFFDIGAIPPLSAGTISAWVRPDDVGTERGAVAAGASGGGASVYFSFMNENGNRIRVDLDDGAARRDALDPAAQVPGQWYHVATTFADDGTLRLYIDGLEVDSQGLAGDNAPYVMTGTGLIGTERLDSRFWIGAIDDVRIWDEELDADAVMTLFTDGPLVASDFEDLDNDGLDDVWEQQIIDADPDDDIQEIEDVLPEDDFDVDAADNEREFADRTDPVDPDTDDDLLLDGIETNDGSFDSVDTDTGTDPRNRDTDADGLPDGVETNDGSFDDIATDTGTHPLVADTDEDGMPDGYEAENMLDPLSDDRALDPDMDGSDNFNEFTIGTAPQDPDSDDDGWLDGPEDNTGTFTDLGATGTDPLDPDTDGDGLLDGVETNDGSFDDPLTDTGTHPLVEDSDNDDFRDGAEVNLHGTDPTNSGSTPATLTTLFIGGNATGNQGADDEVIRLVEDKYGISNVTYLQANASVSGDEEGFDLLILSSTPGSGDIRSKFENSLVPIVNWEEAISDNGAGEFGMSTVTMIKSTTITDIILTDHPIGGGLPDTVTLFDAPGPETTSTDGLFPGLASVGDTGDGSGNSMIFVADVGDAVDPGSLIIDSIAPARRVMLPWTDATAAALTDDGWTLLGNALDWAVGRIGGSLPDRITAIDYDDTTEPGNIIVTLTFTSELGKTYAIYTSTDFAMPVTERSDIDDSVEGGDGSTIFEINFADYGLPLDDTRRFFVVLENE
ncbi:MAG: LamG-like jellyroll fold domain-containing protein [Verrucomicrobiales bacterium]